MVSSHSVAGFKADIQQPDDLMERGIFTQTINNRVSDIEDEDGGSVAKITEAEVEDAINEVTLAELNLEFIKL